MQFSSRLGKLAPYPFVEISRIIAEKRAAGKAWWKTGWT